MAVCEEGEGGKVGRKEGRRRGTADEGLDSSRVGILSFFES